MNYAFLRPLFTTGGAFVVGKIFTTYPKASQQAVPCINESCRFPNLPAHFLTWNNHPF